MKTNQIFSYALFFLFGVCLTHAQMTIGDTKIGQGVTSPSDWVDYNTTGIYVDVNTSGCNFTSTPHYMVTLEGTGGFHWYISGVPSIYNATPTGFRVYLRWTDAPSDLNPIGSLNFPNPLRASTALNRGWVIRWTAIEVGACSSCDSRSSRVTSNSVLNSPFGNESDIETVDVELEDSNTSTIKLFPNPGSSKITISSPEKVYKCEIYNSQAQLIVSSKTNVLDISNLEKGNYVIKIYTEKGIVSKKFIK